MGTAILRVIKKNLFGIITAILSAGILLAFLFSSDGISSLGRVSQSIRYEWLLLAVAAAVAAWILEGVVLNLFAGPFTANGNSGIPSASVWRASFTVP